MFGLLAIAAAALVANGVVVGYMCFSVVRMKFLCFFACHITEDLMQPQFFLHLGGIVWANALSTLVDRSL